MQARDLCISSSDVQPDSLERFCGSPSMMGNIGGRAWSSSEADATNECGRAHKVWWVQEPGCNQTYVFITSLS
jgi:hypothetical protein